MCIRDRVRAPERSLFFFGVPLSFHLFFVWRRVITKPSTSRIWYITPHDVYTWHVFINTECCCCSVCCYTAADVAAAAVRHHVRDGKNCCWFIESNSSVFFLFIQTRFIFNVPLVSAVAFTASICLWYILGSYGHARSQGGRQPAAGSPPCIYYVDSVMAACSRVMTRVNTYNQYHTRIPGVSFEIRAVVGCRVYLCS